jgi:hypothetical protein
MTKLKLPLGLNFRDAGDLQRKIVRALNAQGVTYELIAKVAGITSASSIRSYVANQRTPRRDNEVFRKLDENLRSGGDLAHSAPEGDLATYLNLFNGPVEKPEKQPSFDFELKSAQSPTNLYLLSRALHTAFRTDHEDAIEYLSGLVDKYYMYRCSVDADQIIRSYVRIARVPKPRAHICFTHRHPDRHSGLFLDNSPVTTIGIGVLAGAAIHLLGNAENSSASNFIALRKPQARRPNILMGFTTVTSDRGLVSSRVVLIRRPDATPKEVRRMPVTAFDREEERFNVSLLQAPDGLAADSSILIPGSA